MEGRKADVILPRVMLFTSNLSFPMSSTTTASPTSRSPSPSTPESASDTAEPVGVQSPEQSWFYSLKQPSLWDIEQSIYNHAKSEETIEMLGLDDLLERHVLEEYASTSTLFELSTDTVAVQLLRSLNLFLSPPHSCTMNSYG